MQARLDRMPDAMGERRQTVEHPFGTLKAWMGWTHFLTRTLKRQHRNEPPRPGLQHQAGDRDHWCRTAAGVSIKPLRDRVKPSTLRAGRKVSCGTGRPHDRDSDPSVQKGRLYPPL
jgi:hypothetical protein